MYACCLPSLIAQGVGAQEFTHYLQFNHTHNVVDPATGAHTQNIANNRTNTKMRNGGQLFVMFLSYRLRLFLTRICLPYFVTLVLTNKIYTMYMTYKIIIYLEQWGNFPQMMSSGGGKCKQVPYPGSISCIR